MKVIRIASILVALVAAVFLVRMAVFMVDADQRGLSILPSDKWRTEHSCLTAYTEAARFAEEPATNIYDPTLYDKRYIEGLKVDTYHYPPPFLVVPGALQYAGGDYLGVRPIWFALQLALLIATALVLARWIGGREGQLVRLAVPLFLIAPTTLFTLQTGNFQSSALALSLLGMIALASARPAVQAAGGLALAYATLSKVFPGVLGIYFLVMRRWRAVAWTVAGALVLCALAMLAYGTQPFDDFINYQLPRLSNGAAFPQSELPRIVAVNQSVYGLLVKLRHVGVSGLDIATGLRITSVYGFVVLAGAGFATWRLRARAIQLSRLETAQLWLAVLNLASFRSPFVGGVYGQIGTIWLITLLLAGATSLRGRLVWAAAYLAFGIALLVTPSPSVPPSQPIVWFSIVIHVLMIALNVVVIVRAARATR